jgi:hypothetical protein
MEETAYFLNLTVRHDRPVVLVGAQKLSLVTGVTLIAYFINQVFTSFFPDAVAFVFTVAAALWFASILRGWLDTAFRFYPEATVARKAAFVVAQRESRPEKLDSAFCNVLQGWGQSDRALIISGPPDARTWHRPVRWAGAASGTGRQCHVEALSAGEFVGRRGAPGIGDRTEPFVPHSGETAIGLEPHHSRTRARLFGDSNLLTHMSAP